MAAPIPAELAFKMGAEAMRSKCAAWLMFKGFIVQAGDLLTLPAPPFELPEVMTIQPECVCAGHKSGESTGGWWCPVHKQQL